jgi:hypothetical protein
VEGTDLGGLLAYDLKILRKGARAAFSKKRDLLLLACAGPIVLLLAAQGASNAVMTLRDVSEPLKMLIVAATAAFVDLAVARRIGHLEAESVVARLALRTGPRLLHRLFWNAVPLMASVSIMAVGSASPSPWPLRLAALILAYAAGCGAGAAMRLGLRRIRRWRERRYAAAAAVRPRRLPGEERRQRIVSLMASRSGLAGPSIAANAALFAGIGALILLLYRLSQGIVAKPGPEVIAALAAAIAFGLLLRQHPPLLRYLLYLGIHPVRPALVPVTSACALVAALVLGASVSDPAQAPIFAAAGTAAILLFAILAAFRALHYATRSKQAADLAMQVDAVVILLAGFVAPPLGAGVLIARLVLLHRRVRSSRYMAF